MEKAVIVLKLYVENIPDAVAVTKHLMFLVSFLSDLGQISCYQLDAEEWPPREREDDVSDC